MRGAWDSQNVSNRAWFLLAGLMLTVRVLIAARLPLLGDEAFYWQESRALALSYTDLPPMTAWLIALGTAIAGDSLIGIRWPFVLLGASLPWLLRHWAFKRLGNQGEANAVAVYASLLPLLATGGLLALPDVPLTVLMIAAFVLLDGAADRWRWRDAWMLGICIALALLTHWRAAVLVFAGLLWLTLSDRGRSCGQRRECWLALLLAGCGLLPVLWFNASNEWSAMRFQIIERNPWSFQSSGLWIGLEQFLAITPLVAILLAAVWLRTWRQRALPPFDLLWVSGAGIVGFYLLVGLFADNERTRIHWPLPGYLPLLIALPPLLREWRSRGGWRLVIARYALISAAGVAIVLLVGTMLAGSPFPAQQRLAARIFGEGFMGWNQVARETQRLAAQLPDDAVLIADNFLLGAQLDFALSHAAHKVYVLDHPRNLRHGRQRQLAIWQRDEAHLMAGHWSRGLLVVEVSARAPGDWLGEWQSLCHRFGSLRWLHEEHIAATASSILYAEVRPMNADVSPRCEVPVMARVDFPVRDARVSREEPLRIQGWAIADDSGVAAVQVLLNEVPVGAAQTQLLSPHVLGQLPQSRDPDHPFVGFRLDIDLAAIAPGRHRIDIEVHGRNREALVRRFGPVWVNLD